MGRYLLFSGPPMDALGGWDDFEGAFETQEAAEARLEELQRQSVVGWWHIVDARRGEIIEQGGE